MHTRCFADHDKFVSQPENDQGRLLARLRRRLSSLLIPGEADVLGCKLSDIKFTPSTPVSAQCNITLHEILRRRTIWRAKAEAPSQFGSPLDTQTRLRRVEALQVFGPIQIFIQKCQITGFAYIHITARAAPLQSTDTG
mmetsp:Transcript_5328/g.15916  ORF Transcript_5328/g.15916 Transcript_5328/m.15916 type:complete len:139 (-) Transcript_5328:3689-4105(-)